MAAEGRVEEEEMKRIAAAARRSFEQIKAVARARARREFVTGSVDDKSNQTVKKCNQEYSNGTVGWKCNLCKDDLATKHHMEQEIDVAEVSVLACGHVYHSACFRHLIPFSQRDSRDPPCFSCQNGLC